MRLNDHQPVPVSSGVIITDAHMAELKDFLADLHDTSQKLPPAVLSDNQFEKLVAMLQPGFELSTLMLADYKRLHAAPGPGVIVAPGVMSDQELADFNIAHGRPVGDQTERLRRQAELAPSAPLLPLVEPLPAPDDSAPTPVGP